MTAIVLLEQVGEDRLNEEVIVSKEAAGTMGSRLGLGTGDKLTYNDLLYGLMLCSGNDAAVQIAISVSGSVENFVELMNKKAIELGLENTHFVTPHGLDREGHYTTALELAKIADYALNIPKIAKLVSTKEYTVTINGYPKALSNTNELLGNLLGVYGIKTGFTNGANRCLVTACKRNDMDIICVVLGCDTKKFRTQDSIKLIEYAYKNFEYVNISEKINKEFKKWKTENIENFCITKGITSNIDLEYSDLSNPIIPIRKSEIESLNVNISSNYSLNAPIKENTVIGRVTVTVNTVEILSLEILSNNSIEKKNFINYFTEVLKNYAMVLNSFTSL